MATKISTLPQILSVDLHSSESVQRHQLGTYVETSDGRGFRYAKAGATALVAGNIYAAPARKTNHDDMATNTAAIGDTTVTVTLGNTAATANEYAEGLLIVNGSEAGTGKAYRVKSHPAADASASLVVTLEDPIDVAFNASVTATLMHNPYNAVIGATSATVTPAGVATEAITASEFGWLQTRGIASCLADETLAIGSELVLGSSTAGSVEVLNTVTAPQAEFKVGYAIVAGVDGDRNPINLTLD